MRHIFHRLLLYRLFRTRLPYLPGYTSCSRALLPSHVAELYDFLEARIRQHKDALRHSIGALHRKLHEKIEKAIHTIHGTPSEEETLFDMDNESQKAIFKAYDVEWEEHSRAAKVMKERQGRVQRVLELSEVRETQVQMRLGSEDIGSRLKDLRSGEGKATHPVELVRPNQSQRIGGIVLCSEE